MCALRKKSVKPQLVILDDKAIDSSKRDDFDHKSIAKSLKTIIGGAPTPSTIGLLANWGSGKTGIARLLKKLIKEDSKTAYIEFDVWKYEDEASIRRQFMYSMYHQLDAQDLLGKNSKLSDRLEGSVSTELNDGVTYDPASLARLLILCTIVGVAIVVAILMDNALIISGTLIASVIGVVGIETFIKTGLKVFKNKKRIVTQSRMTDADEFEEEFTDLVDKSKANKIIIVIDNLDRATDEKAVAILATIKSFLEYDKCIYIIPCDEDAIKKHLQRIFNDGNGNKTSGADADEFLRKFFNSYLRIPKFIDADLQDYTEKQLEGTNIHHYYPNIQNLATIITAAYRGNPRQIKQFINVFVAHFTLAVERERQGLLPEGDITQNPEFLAKILIIKQRWNDAYETLLTGVSVADADKDEQYQEFLRASSLAEEPSNIKSFLHFKQSSRATNLPPGAADSLQTAIEDSKVEDVKNLIQEIQSSKDHEEAINQFILQLIEEAYRRNREQILVNVIRSLSLVWRDGLININATIKSQLAKALADRLNAPGIFTLDIDFVEECLNQSSTTAIRDKAIAKFINGIGGDNINLPSASENVIRTMDLLERLVSASKLTPALKKTFNDLIQNYFQDYSVVNHLHNHKVVLNILDSSAMAKLSSTISNTDLSESSEEPDLYTLKSQILISSPSVTSAIVTQYIDNARLISQEALNNTARTKSLSEILSLLLEFTIHKLNTIEKGQVIDSLVNEFIQVLKRGIQPDWQLGFVKVLLSLDSIVTDEQKSDIFSTLQQALRSNEAAWTEQLLESGIVDKDELLSKIFRPIYDKGLNDTPFAQIIWKNGNDEQKLELIDGIFAHNPTRSLKAIDEQISGNGIKNKEALAKLILKFATMVPRGSKLEFYQHLARIKIGDSLDARRTARDQILQLAQEPDEAGRSMARDVFNILRGSLSKQVRNELTTALIEWMEKLGKLNSSFIPVLNLCFETFDTISKSDANRLYQLIFSQWLLQESDGQQILRARDLALDNIDPQEVAKFIEGMEQKKQREPGITSELDDLINYIGSKIKNN